MDIAELRGLQSSLLTATMLSATMCGVHFTLAGVTIYRLHGMTSLPRRTFRTLCAIVVTGALLFLAQVASLASLLNFVFVSTNGIQAWPTQTVFLCTALALGLGDSLFIYRCWIIWGRSRWFLVAVPILLAEFLMSVFSLILNSRHGAGVVGLWETAPDAKALVTAAILLTVSLNIVLAAAAITRLLLARRALRSAALPAGGAHYVQISRVLALSSALYAAVWMPLLLSPAVSRATPYYVALFAVVAGTPLAVTLQVGRCTHDAQAVVRGLPRV